jgi:hypothetical protein
MAHASSTRHVLASSGFTLCVLVLLFAVFTQAIRPSTVYVVPRPPSHAPPPPANQTGVIDDKHRRRAVCEQVCGGPDAVCQQSAAADAAVLACVQCGGGLVAVGVRCVDPRQCTDQRWCSTDEARSMLETHNDLLRVAMEASPNRNATDVRYPYAGVISDTPQWAATLSARFTTPSRAVEALNLYLQGRVVQNIRTSPTLWFDDQEGWWKDSLTAYNATLPPAYGRYVDEFLKPSHCDRFWRLNTTSGLCQAP